MRRQLTALGAMVVLLVTLSGCGKAGSTTCVEFGGMSYTERDSTLRNLLDEHRLEELDLGNNLGVQEAVDSFCGTRTTLLLEDSPATRNLDQPIDDAVDWDSEYW